VSDRRVLGMNERNYLIRRFSSPDSLDLAGDKLGFKRMLQAHGLPTAKTYHEIHDHQDLQRVGEFPGVFVVKPNRGHGGYGVLVLKRSRGGFRSPSGQRYSEKQVRQHIKRILEGEYSDALENDSALVEERLYPAAEICFDDLSGLPDVRTFFMGDEPRLAMFRYSTKESAGRSNLSKGAIGIAVDLETGRFLEAHEKGNSEQLGLASLGIPEGFTLPSWPEMLAVSRRASSLSGLYLAGVDATLTTGAEVKILEINGFPGLEIQNVNERTLGEPL